MSPSKDPQQEDVDLLMPAPWTDPPPLSPVDGGETNLLPRSAWIDPNNPLKVRFAPWAPSDPSESGPESIIIFLGTTEIGSRQWTAPISPDDHFVTISADKLSPGEHLLTYEMTNWLGTPQGSNSFTITVDKQEPLLGNPNRLVFPAEVAPPPKKITAVYLAANQDRVLADLPRYTDPKPGDLIRWYWGASQGDLNEAGVIALDKTNYLDPVIVAVTGDLLRDRKDGMRYASYRVWDRAGNPSVHSEVVELDVAATPIPRILPPSKVKEASGGSASGVLIASNAVNGVTVTIPPEAVIHEGERVFVQWAAQGTVGEFRTDTPVTPGSRDYTIPNTKIAQHMGKTLPVTYEVFEPGVVDPHKSQLYTLRVEDLTGMPTVQCDKVSGGKLSLASVTGFANFTLESWTFMATDQFLTVTVEGVDASSSQKLVIPVLTESPVPQVAQVIPAGQISKTDLQRFKLNAGFEVRVKVSFDNKESWKSFPMLTPTLIA